MFTSSAEARLRQSDSGQLKLEFHIQTQDIGPPTQVVDNRLGKPLPSYQTVVSRLDVLKHEISLIVTLVAIASKFSSTLCKVTWAPSPLDRARLGPASRHERFESGFVHERPGIPKTYCDE